MADLVYNPKDDLLEKLLLPMFRILDEKNISNGITYLNDKEKLYICFDKNYLSDNNQLILEKIAYVYSETIFYSDNVESPSLDRLEYWCPDEEYDKSTHITERCRNKKYAILELDINDILIILGTSIMIANALQEQDPLNLKSNRDLNIYDSDIIERHEHYISSGYPDLRWINLSVSLNKDNPLRENPYASLMSVFEINSPVSCDNVILATLIGYNEKTYVKFCMDKEELEKTIRGYFNRKQENDMEIKKYILDRNVKKLGGF